MIRGTSACARGGSWFEGWGGPESKRCTVRIRIDAYAGYAGVRTKIRVASWDFGVSGPPTNC